MSELGPIAWKPILELPMGSLLYHFILIYPPLPIDLEPVILPGKRSVIFSQMLKMASILLSSRMSCLKPQDADKKVKTRLWMML